MEPEAETSGNCINGSFDGGLARFQSAPATWLEALLESDDDLIIDPSPSSTFNQLSFNETGNLVDPTCLVLPVTGNWFLRQNSSPADFLSQIDGSNYNLQDPVINFTAQLSGDQSGLMDVKMDKIQEDSSVPFRVRAKRGFATHPRSIAERVRRTRISERIRKLQELVPNMDKQANTAEMLEEAVEYVKFLQTQIMDLTERQSKCTCSIKD